MIGKYLKYFCCPHCGGSLYISCEGEIETSQRGQENAEIRCSGCCARYRITDYIPRFVESDRYCTSFGMQWNRHRRIQIDKYNGYTFSRDRLFSVTGWPSRLDGQLVLEVGSGAGRFTQVLLETGAHLFTFDCSNAVEANFKNNDLNDHGVLFQADSNQLPLRKGIFDKIICLGMLQHTPDPERTFNALIPFLKPGGEIVIDVYKMTFTSMIQWKYLLRPILKHIRPNTLYKYIKSFVPLLLPTAVFFRKIGGGVGGRLLPIANYSHLKISKEMNKELSILDTFDMYAPKYDRPQTIGKVKKWFDNAGLSSVRVKYGPNGIVGRGIKV